MIKKIKSENKILIMLAFFSVSVGLWENFRQLWLQSNNFSITDISNIISLGTFVSAIALIFTGKYIHINKLKKFVTLSLIIKVINIIFLLLLNNSSHVLLINISIIIDILMGYMVSTSVYPLITTIVKNNTIYSKRKLTEYLFKDIGVLIGGILIGKNLFGKLIDYNYCLLISLVFLIFSIFSILNNINIKNQKEKDSGKSLLKYILKNKIQFLYMVYTFIGATAMSTALGLKMLTFTNYFKFTDSQATKYLLIIGILADIIGILVLKFLTPKNDYISVSIKFGIRFVGYLIAFLTNNLIISFIAITWSILISTSYENVCDGYYINIISNEYQLRYTNMRYIIRYFGEAFGVFLCGLMYIIGLRYMFGLSSLFLIIQISLAYYLIYLRKK